MMLAIASLSLLGILRLLGLPRPAWIRAFRPPCFALAFNLLVCLSESFKSLAASGLLISLFSNFLMMPQRLTSFGVIVRYSILVKRLILIITHTNTGG